MTANVKRRVESLLDNYIPNVCWQSGSKPYPCIRRTKTPIDWMMISTILEIFMTA
jgi:hypothetical protein